jgi:hypothetical protein
MTEVEAPGVGFCREAKHRAGLRAATRERRSDREGWMLGRDFAYTSNRFTMHWQREMK